MNAPAILYHGSAKEVRGPLVPVLRHGTEDHVHHRAAVFATERIDIAALFMIPSDVISSIGFEQDIAYICVWGTPEEFAARDSGGFVHELPGDRFEKVGKSYEWQCFAPVEPVRTRRFASAIGGMLECGALVYFVNDDPTFDRIVEDKEHRAPLLAGLVSENERKGLPHRTFSAV